MSFDPHDMGYDEILLQQLMHEDEHPLSRRSGQDWVPDAPNGAIQGSQTSHGFRKVLFTGAQVGGLRVRRQSGVPGLASVGIQVAITNFVNGESAANQRLMCEIKWKNGDGGGDALVDVTRGGFFTVSGTDSIDTDYFVLPQDKSVAGPGSLGQTVWNYMVEATVNWNGSVNPVKARVTDFAVHILAGVASTPVLIPRYAESLLALTDNPAALAGLEARFMSDAGAVPRIVYTTLNPNANGTPVTHGVQALSLFHATTPMIIVPCWDMWL